MPRAGGEATSMQNHSKGMSNGNDTGNSNIISWQLEEVFSNDPDPCGSVLC